MTERTHCWNCGYKLPDREPSQTVAATDWAPMGTQEVAEYCGLTRQRVWQLVSEGNIAPPLWRLYCGPIWRDRDIVEWFNNRIDRRKSA